MQLTCCLLLPTPLLAAQSAHQPRLALQLDNSYNKLRSLCEYVDDTEDFINIELDSHRNQLIRVGGGALRGWSKAVGMGGGQT